MLPEELQSFINNPIDLKEAIELCCKQISLSAQSLAKKELELEHIKIYKETNLALDRLTYTKYLTISLDNLMLYKEAAIAEEAAEGIITDLKVYIYEHSNKSSNVLTYLDVAAKDAFNLTDDRMEKLLKVITTTFNGKRIDKRDFKKEE